MMGRCGFCMFPSCLESWASFFVQARQLPATFQRCAHCKIGSSKLLAGLTCPDSSGKSVYRKWLDGLSLPLLLLSTSNRSNSSPVNPSRTLTILSAPKAHQRLCPVCLHFVSLPSVQRQQLPLEADNRVCPKPTKGGVVEERKPRHEYAEKPCCFFFFIYIFFHLAADVTAGRGK